MMCKKCGICGDSRDIQDGYCSVCEAEAAGRRPTYTLPRDEWDEMTPAQKKAAKAKGIRCEAEYGAITMDSPSNPDAPTL